MDVLQVRFPESARPVTCDANGLELDVGDFCVVKTPAGERMGRVTRATWNNPAWDERENGLLKVLRRAGREDEEDHAHRFRQDENALEGARRRIAERGLPMRLIGVDRVEGGQKVIFSFTAEGRVDFRGLVRDLAVTHRARIEMRQIGVRDEARSRGGYGHCGRPLCCSTWLPGFQPVSIRNAKAQGLSLSPSKISGMCGRLMCCLRYELDSRGRPLASGGCGTEGSCGRKEAAKGGGGGGAVGGEAGPRGGGNGGSRASAAAGGGGGNGRGASTRGVGGESAVTEGTGKANKDEGRVEEETGGKENSGRNGEPGEGRSRGRGRGRRGRRRGGGSGGSSRQAN